jgi:alcohol dehydrogenase
MTAALPLPVPRTPDSWQAPPAAARWEARLGAVRVAFGEGRLAELGEEARRLGASRVLLVTDPGVAAAGHAAAAAQALGEAGCAVAVFDRVAENPTADQVAAGAAFARDPASGPGSGPVELIAALGGGSAMDCAKGINFLLTHGGRMADYQGFGKAAGPMLPSIGVPTTAGTGSEAQSYALITDPASHRKMACGAGGARFRTVILDPLLAATAPPAVAAAAGLDAVAHAVESLVATRANPVSRMLSREAWRRLVAGLDVVLGATGGGERLRAAWADALLGAHLAGAAIEQSMLGAAPAAANPLTARYGIVHGVAVALMLPAVVRFNAAAAGGRYAELVAAAGDGERRENKELGRAKEGNREESWPTRSADREGGAADVLAARIERLRAAGGLPARLSECGVERAAIPALAADAATQWTGGFNPRPVSAEDFEDLYAAAF